MSLYLYDDSSGKTWHRDRSIEMSIYPTAWSSVEQGRSRIVQIIFESAWVPSKHFFFISFECSCDIFCSPFESAFNSRVDEFSAAALASGITGGLVLLNAKRGMDILPSGDFVMFPQFEQFG